MAYETRTTTIGEILLLHPSTEGNKAWVDGFQATVRNSKAIKARNGSVFYTGQFCDPQDERYQIKGTCNIDITRFEGMMVDVGGQGISKESYKGADEIKIGQKATIVPVANQQQQLPVQSALRLRLRLRLRPNSTISNPHRLSRFSQVRHPPGNLSGQRSGTALHLRSNASLKGARQIREHRSFSGRFTRSPAIYSGSMNTWKSGISPNLQRFERQGLKSWFLKGLLKAPLLLLFLFPLLLLRHCTRTLLGNLRNRGRNRRFRNRR